MSLRASRERSGCRAAVSLAAGGPPAARCPRGGNRGWAKAFRVSVMAPARCGCQLDGCGLIGSATMAACYLQPCGLDTDALVR